MIALIEIFLAKAVIGVPIAKGIAAVGVVGTAKIFAIKSVIVNIIAYFL